MSRTPAVRRGVASARRRRHAKLRHQALPWTRLPDEKLLSLRFCDLKLSIERSALKRQIRRLYIELESRGIRFRPHAWLSEEWFSPDGVPGIAVPFYLAHPRLERLERRIMREAEGGNSRWFMRILRHEAGHALDNAYRLRRRKRWREVFGPASLQYPARYKARSEEHTSELQSQSNLVCSLLLEKTNSYLVAFSSRTSPALLRTLTDPPCANGLGVSAGTIRISHLSSLTTTACSPPCLCSSFTLL